VIWSWKVPWSTTFSLTLVPPLAALNAATTFSKPARGPGSDWLLPIDTVPPVEVVLVVVVVPLPQAARNAAMLV